MVEPGAILNCVADCGCSMNYNESLALHMQVPESQSKYSSVCASILYSIGVTLVVILSAWGVYELYQVCVQKNKKKKR